MNIRIYSRRSPPNPSRAVSLQRAVVLALLFLLCEYQKANSRGTQKPTGDVRAPPTAESFPDQRARTGRARSASESAGNAP